MAQPKWTRMDDELLRRHYATMGHVALMRLLPGRGWQGIRRRANGLGLKRQSPRLNPLGRPGERERPR